MNLVKVNGKKNIGNLIIFLLITLGGGYIVSAFTSKSANAYKMLEQPSFVPPSWVFYIVWVVLYVLMGIAIYRIWMLKESKVSVKKAVVLFFIQLAINFLWPIVFFRLRLYAIAFFLLLILIGVIILTIMEFMKLDKTSAYLLIPYLLWCIFAAYLSYNIWMINC